MTEKTNTNPVLADPIFYERQSPRSFTNERVDEDTLMTLFEAARWAPSSFNEQPWRFIYAIKGDKKTEHMYDQLLSCLNEENQQWAKDAQVLLLTIAKKNFSNGKENRHAWHDVGLAMGNFTMQATQKNLIVHQMAGFSEERATATFDLPEDLEPVAMAAIGYPAKVKENRMRKALNKLLLNTEVGKKAYHIH